jgi:hypothetical protein
MKWKLSVGLNGYLADFSQLIFAQSRMGAVAGTNANLGDLFGGLTTGQTTDPALAAVLLQPGAMSPETSFAYGNRQLGLSGSLTLSYAPTTRSTYSLSGSYSRAESLRTGSSGGAEGLVHLPKMNGGSLDFSWSYSLTPRTNFSADVGESRVVSGLQDVSTTQTNVSIGRTLSPRWFVQGSVGMGFTRPRYETFGSGRTAQEQWGGSIGFHAGSQTFVGAFGRAASDVYGVGAAATISGSGAWAWNRPGKSYSVTSAFGYSRLLGAQFNYSGSLFANAGLRKALGANMQLSLAYSFVQYPRSLAQATFNSASLQSLDGVVLALGWAPGRRQARAGQ